MDKVIYKNYDVVVVNPRFDAIRSAVENLPLTFPAEGQAVYSGRNTVKRFRFGEADVAVKQFKRPGFVQRVVYSFFRPSKARRAYEYAFRLSDLGIGTPEPICFIEKRQSGLFTHSYFACVFETGPDCSFLNKAGQQAIDGGSHDGLISALAAELARCHKRGFLHGDLNLTNVIYHAEEQGGYRFTFIDINRSRFASNPTVAQRAVNLMRLTHRRYLLERIISFYNQCFEANDRVPFDLVEKQLERFEKRKKFLYFLKGKTWNPA